MAELKDSGARRDFVGMRFGRLVINYICDKSRSGHVVAHCKCDCGSEKEIALSALIKGSTKSCGCYRREITAKRTVTHGKCGTRLYSIWCDMKRRCNNPKNKRYENYGGKGVIVCEQWSRNFQSFYNWAIENGYSDELTIDRVDVNKNYEPSNCRWATLTEQQNNTTRNHYLRFGGETKTLAQWEKVTGISQDILKDRINKLGWSASRALTTPVRRENVC